MNDIDIIIIVSSLAVLLLITSTILLLKLLKFRKKIKTLVVAYSKIENLLSLKQDHEIDNNVHKESFIKFLSDSRDWAYEYIETVQSGLNKFVSDVDADISHFDEYGDTLSMQRPDYTAMKNISTSYKELKKLLPTEEKQ
jgi:hypothetical protein